MFMDLCLLVSRPIYRYHALWIGLSERRRKSVYEWTDNTKVSFTNWDPHEPNNYGGVGSKEDCVTMYISVRYYIK